jgi:hypothetical protein
MDRVTRIRTIQGILGVDVDGYFAAESQRALTEMLRGVHWALASSFADPADIAAFRRCKAEGKSDEECFEVGDNGIGCWGDDVTQLVACALPPEDMIERWLSVEAAKHKPVLVHNGIMTARCILADRMPHRAQITNGAGIDLSPLACAELGLTPPVLAQVIWEWDDET